MTERYDAIHPDTARTLHGLFLERVRRMPDAIAYRQYDPAGGRWCDYTWAETAAEVTRWQGALRAEGLEPGDRVAIMLRNGREWVLFDQAALGLGLIVVPLYTSDRAGNVTYILNDAGVKLLFLEGTEQWNTLAEHRDKFLIVQRIITLEPVENAADLRLLSVADWLKNAAPGEPVQDIAVDALATIVYTSGTTGRPKGVMLSHHNFLENAWAAGIQRVGVRTDDRFLSFLPLSHNLERMAGYYLPMMAGASVVYARSIPDLAEDLAIQKPTVLISVPRIYERIYNRIQDELATRPNLVRRLFHTALDVGWSVFERRQGRGRWRPAHLAWPLLRFLVGRPVAVRLGGRLRVATSGGAPLNPTVARLFLGLGIPLIQGYGLTETSPVIASNSLQDNLPHSVGQPLVNLEVRIGAQNELLVRGPSVMLGYWNDPEATRRVLEPDGWLHTEDLARFEDGHIVITGRIKDIIVLANGEKVSPLDMEMAISTEPLIEEEQVVVVGESRPYLSALVVLNREAWASLAREQGFADNPEEAGADARVEQLFLERISGRLHDFPGYAQVRRVAVLAESWSVENALLTPTLKPRRNRILERYGPQIDRLYEKPSPK